MAASSKNFWSRFFALPENNQSYLPYILSFKFIWAPIVFIVLTIKNWLFGFFGTSDKRNTHTVSPEEHTITITGTPLYKDSNMTPSLSSPKEIVEPVQMLEQFETNPFSNDQIGNTPLTSFLAARVFNSLNNYKELYQQEIKAVLTQLCELAKTSKTAQKLLSTPNDPNIEVNANLIKSGMPVNTPLMLLVKAGDIEAVKLVLPFYSAEELMRTTPRGNSVFHIASITGQEEILVALKNRAQELNIWNAYREHRNNAGYTAYQMLTELYSTKNFFQNLLDFSDSFLGGEEINKVAVSDHGQKPVHVARRGAVAFYKTLNNEENQPHDLERGLDLKLKNF